ncbi:Tn3 family transposase [Streptomyces luomodiensis]|uniref:Tn3 family transposase n=1 Tax=Streptomyces luomodiensis TaxID=3026192 RepID=UPI003D779CC3
MEDQLGVLGLVLNAVVLWTTKHTDIAVAQLRAEGHDIRDEDVARLSPLKHKNAAAVFAGGLTWYLGQSPCGQGVNRSGRRGWRPGRWPWAGCGGAWRGSWPCRRYW